LSSECYCGSDKPYSDCCGLYIEQGKLPPTPEALMRSRYTAYNLLDMNYIAATMKPPASDHFDADGEKASAAKCKWTQLEIIRTSHDAQHGVVEYRAHYTLENKKKILHEISEFNFENGRWYYVNGILPKQEKVGRNQLCPCGSNKKFKKCCG
jgi:SEC-C motif domain protein